MRHQGRITEWNNARGFGFITPSDGGERVFIHATAFRLGNRRPRPGDFVNYSLSRDENGRARADHATYCVCRSARTARLADSRVGVVVAGLVSIGALSAISVGGWVGKLPLVVPTTYLICSLGAYFHYRKDKAAARSHSWRSEEVALLTWGLFGGWPGALVAQHQFRHKIKKVDFQICFWISVALNCLGLAIVWE